MKWKSIYTAPFDETLILVCDSAHNYEPEILQARNAIETEYFTHWMPLPEPPEETK